MMIRILDNDYISYKLNTPQKFEIVITCTMKLSAWVVEFRGFVRPRNKTFPSSTMTVAV